MRYALYALKGDPTNINLVRGNMVVNGGYYLKFFKDGTAKISPKYHSQIVQQYAVNKDWVEPVWQWVKDLDPSDKRHYNEIIEDYRSTL